MLRVIALLVIFQVCGGAIIKRSTEKFVLRNATQFESPWFALIKLKSNNLICGGSLIKDKYIITAAHCFDGVPLSPQTLKKEVQVILAEWKTETDPDCKDIDDTCDPFADILPKKVIIHEKYLKDERRYRHKHDIAIIQLAWAPRKSELIENIDITDNECDYSYEEEELTVTGFGHTPTSGFGYATVKKSITMTIQSDKYCGENQKDVFIRGNHICGIGTEGETTCSGDSGGGLISNKNGIPMLEGIVAFGVATCGDANKPSGFVKVSCFREWIDSNIVKLQKSKKRT